MLNLDSAIDLGGCFFLSMLVLLSLLTGHLPFVRSYHVAQQRQQRQTHPFDTIKTCMQGDIEREVYGNFVQTARKIGSDSGLTGFYRGATFRYGRMVWYV